MKKVLLKIVLGFFLLGASIHVYASCNGTEYSDLMVKMSDDGLSQIMSGATSFTVTNSDVICNKNVSSTWNNLVGIDPSDDIWTVTVNGKTYNSLDAQESQLVYDAIYGSNTLTASTTPTATVLEVTGQTFSLTSVDIKAPAKSDTIPDIGALLTLADSSIKIQRHDGTIVASKAKTVTVLSPAVESDNSIALVRGEVTSTVDCTNAGDYEVRTIAADIKVFGSCSRSQRASTTSEFTTKYGQSDSNGTVTISVTSGSVEITERNGVTSTLTAGQEKTIAYRVPRTDWALPVDGDKIYGGEDNLFIWKEYPGASSYQIEFNLPTPVFSENNVSRPQYQKQVIPLPVGSYAKIDGDLITFNLPLPKGADGLVLEFRIFALDAAGNIIGESVSSDSVSVTVTD